MICWIDNHTLVKCIANEIFINLKKNEKKGEKKPFNFESKKKKKETIESLIVCLIVLIIRYVCA